MFGGMRESPICLSVLSPSLVNAVVAVLAIHALGVHAYATVFALNDDLVRRTAAVVAVPTATALSREAHTTAFALDDVTLRLASLSLELSVSLAGWCLVPRCLLRFSCSCSAAVAVLRCGRASYEFSATYHASQPIVVHGLVL
jgi:hypothetical protein